MSAITTKPDTTSIQSLVNNTPITPIAKKTTPNIALEKNPAISATKPSQQPNRVLLPEPNANLMAKSASHDSLLAKLNVLQQEVLPPIDVKSSLRLLSLALTSPASFEVELSKVTSELQTNQQKLKLEDIQRIKQQNALKMDENQAKIQESEDAVKESQKSGLAAKIFGWISTVVSAVVGAILVATGVGAVASAANQIVQEAAAAGLISPETMKWLGPTLMGIQIAVGIASIAVSFGGSAATAIAQVGAKIGGKAAEVTAKLPGMVSSGVATTTQSVANNVKTGLEVGNLVADVGETASQLASSITHSIASGKIADAKMLESVMAMSQSILDKLNSDLAKMTDDYQQVMETLAQMIHEKGEVLRELAVRPNTI
ncbi:type III secretion system translocon subunit SctE [Arsenophonus sp.]|uniref:type III secretion system translocon subunit SctE n=1 Tax=Arsenophonus sp. TaxID=1872640 RepID=UPI00286054CE|nr:type III secretion system translocon subunit SctE [Arsenophonus sp.]MDR5617693.1 type III secretion system translocon subunit SctE [Arsenophonus sp.]